MGLTNDGALFHAQNMLGESVTYFDNSNAALGVGDDSTAFNTAQSQLRAETNATSSIRRGMDSGYPERDPGGIGGNIVRYQATFDAGEGNFDWVEWGLFNSATEGGGVMHNREVEDLGSKTSNIIRVFQVDIELAPA